MSQTMDRSNWPLLLIEGVLVFGGALLFGWWQLREIDRDRRELQKKREAEAAAHEDADGPSA
jgi:DNA-binding transcriptional regulator of glucitol operon